MTHNRRDDDDNDEDDHEEQAGGGAGTFLMGLLFGGLIGLGAALLLAPASGEDTRQMLRQRATEVRDEALDRAEQARAKARELEANSREMLEAQTRRMARTAEAVRQSAVEAWSEPAQPSATAAGHISPGAAEVNQLHA